MASSTQQRFRSDTPPAPAARTEPGSLPAGMVVVAPPAPVELTDLLAGYRSALQVADQLPASSEQSLRFDYVRLLTYEE